MTYTAYWKTNGGTTGSMGDLSWGEACFILSSFYVKNCEWVGWIKDERGVTLALRDDEGWDVGHVAEEAMA